MELYALPDTWSNLGADELQSLIAEIQALAAGVEDRTGSLDLLESYAGAVVEIKAKLAADADAAARLEAAEASLAADPDPEPEVEEVIEEDDNAAELAAAAEATAAAEAEELAAAETAAAEEAAAAAIAASPKITSVRPVADTIRAANAARAASERPRIAEQLGTFTASMNVGSVRSGDQIDLEKLAEVIASARDTMGDHTGAATKMTLATSRGQFAEDRKFGKNINDNDVAIRHYIAERRAQLALAASGNAEAMGASGGPLAPVAPTYGFYNPSSAQTPLQSHWDRFEADRGGVRFTPPPSLATVDGTNPLSNGVTIGATDGSTAKGVITVATAPGEEVVKVQPVSKRVRFDNLNYRVYPELVEYMLDKLVEEEAKQVEIDLLNELQTQAGTANVATDAATVEYGAFRHLTGLILSISHWKRKSLNMDNDAVLEWVLPDVVVPGFYADLVRDAGLGANFLNAPLADLKAEMLRRFNLSMVFNYYDATAGAYPASGHYGAVATAKAFPGTIRGYVMAPGSVVIPEIGEQNFGMMRDSVLNGTNDVELFSERWINLAHIGTSIDPFDMILNPTGVAPAGFGSYDPSLTAP